MHMRVSRVSIDPTWREGLSVQPDRPVPFSVLGVRPSILLLPPALTDSGENADPVKRAETGWSAALRHCGPAGG
jgi:hypothetical protein